MTLKELIELVEGQVVAPTNDPAQLRLDVDVSGVYVSDLLSDVMGHARAGQVWLTIQTHPNVVAVALLLNLAAIVFTAGQHPEEETIQKAVEEDIVLITTALSTFETGGKVHSYLESHR